MTMTAMKMTTIHGADDDDYDKDDAAGSEWPLDEFIRRIEEQLKSRFVNTQAVVYYQYNNSDSTVSVLQEQEQSFVMALTGRKPSSNGGNSSTSSTKQPSASGGGTGGKPGARGKSRRGNASADGFREVLNFRETDSLNNL